MCPTEFRHKEGSLDADSVSCKINAEYVQEATLRRPLNQSANVSGLFWALRDKPTAATGTPFSKLPTAMRRIFETTLLRQPGHLSGRRPVELAEWLERLESRIPRVCQPLLFCFCGHRPAAECLGCSFSFEQFGFDVLFADGEPNFAKHLGRFGFVVPRNAGG